MNDDKIFRSIERLREPRRLALLETERVVSLCLQGPEVEKVLDIGTGSGVFAELFFRLGLDVTGIDLQEPMLEAARSFLPKAHFQVADSDALPFGDDSFDLCFLGLVLHETKRPRRTLREAHRVCAKRTAVLEWAYAEQDIGPPLKDRLRPDEVLRMGNAAGFSRIMTIPLEHLILFLLDK
jgi:ubiquinone/menaquinone biosynthesis C-methylase UbiE